MKRFSKIFAVIFAVAVALTVAIIAVSAASDATTVTVILDNGGTSISSKSETVSETPAVGSYFEYEYDGWRVSYKVTSVSGGEIKLDYNDARYYAVIDGAGNAEYVTKASINNSSNLSYEALLEAVGEQWCKDATNLQNGYTIQLLSDIYINKGAVAAAQKTVYFDLNGFNLVFTSDTAVANGYHTAFNIANATLYMYSSRPGGNLFHSVPNSAANPVAYSVFYPTESCTEFNLFLGAYNGIDGDNLSIFANMLVNISSKNSANVNIDGGSYYRYNSTYMPAMFYLRDGSGETNLNIKNASLNAQSKIFYFYSSNTTAGTKNFNINVENSVLLTGGPDNKVVVAENQFLERLKKTPVNFKNCYFLSELGSPDIINVGEGCRFNSVGANIGNLYFAKIAEKKQISFKTNSFAFTDEFKLDLSSLSVSVDTAEYFFSYATASEENSSLITWKDHNGDVTTERWVNGELPRPVNALPDGNDSYYYTYGTITEVNGDKTYVAKPVAKFGLKVNLTLASDFIYNVYIPENVADSIKEVRLYNSNGEGVVLERGELSTINGVPYYRYFFNIQASKAADAFSFDMDIYTDDAKTEYFTQKCEMSIPAYSAEIIYNDKYSDATHNLMNKVLAYVKAACDYFKTAGENKYYSAISNISSVTAPLYRAGEAVASLDETPAVKSVLGGTSVIFGSQLKYRFYFKSGVDFSSNTVKLSYVNNESVVVETVTSQNVTQYENGSYYDVVLKASDMRSDIKLTVNSESFTYNLSNYIYEVNKGSDESAKQLVYSLWEYSEAAGKFSNETPEVDVTINGTPISYYKIVANTTEERAAAEIFKATILKEHGITLEILTAYNGKAIEFRSVSPDSLIDYCVSLDGDNLVIECAYRSFFESATDAFVNDVFANLNRDLDINGDFSAKYLYGKILYSDFDVPTFNGKAEDFNGKSAAQIDAAAGENAYFAIKRAHDIANAKGYPVYAEKDATYFIDTSKNLSGKIETVVIKTDTYWQGADFIINDSSLANLTASENRDVAASVLFRVENDQGAASVSPELLLDADGNGKRPLYTTDIKFKNGLGYKAMLLVTNSEVTQYIRYGYTTKQGKEQQELILIDENGNIDPSTPALFDFTNVTSITAYRADTKPIVIDGGDGCTMTTLSSQVVLHATSSTIARNLSIERANTTVRNIEHVIYNEPAAYNASNAATGGHSYSGFFTVARANNVSFEDCVVQGRSTCKEGTYDISISYSNNVVYRNLTQSNLYKENGGFNFGLWWVMGSNYCKNITYDTCKLSRFDAHAGVYNATIKNSEIFSIRLTGGGTFNLENTTVYQETNTTSNGFVETGMIELREDYGSTWRGDINIKDVHYSYLGPDGSKFAIIWGQWEHHDFGYDITLPNVTVNNLTFSSNISSKIKDVYVFNITNGVNENEEYDQSHTYSVTEKITHDGIEQTVTKTITYNYDAATYAMFKSLQDLRAEEFNVAITRTETYVAVNSDGTKETVTNTVTVQSFENINPYTAPERVQMTGMNEAYNYHISTGFSSTFEKTSFIVNPPDFNDSSDTPIIDLY